MRDDKRPTFLGLNEFENGPFDLVILPIPLEITTSWKDGTASGPKACIDVSSQIELFDPILGRDLPCGLSFHTAKEWSSEESTLRKQLDSIKEYLKPWLDGEQFPLILGGEHGILLPVIEALKDTVIVDNLADLTIIQIDAHADLRDSLNNEKYSHGTVIRRCLDEGVGKVIQIGVRAYSKEEFDLINEDDRIETWFARSIVGRNNSGNNWKNMIERLKTITGSVWLTFDIDGLDSSLVPSTGTPMPGGLSYWDSIEIIEALFSIKNVNIIGADVNEINQGGRDRITEFNAALIATKIITYHAISTLI